MTQEEKNALKIEILEEVSRQFAGTALREDIQGTLAGTRNKWFRGEHGKSLMYDAFGGYTYWAVWEHIRKLVCFICGQRYVRQIAGDEMANDIADELCKQVYDLRLKHLEAEHGKENS